MCTGVLPGLMVRVQVSVYRCSTWSRGACTGVVPGLMVRVQVSVYR